LSLYEEEEEEEEEERMYNKKSRLYSPQLLFPSPFIINVKQAKLPIAAALDLVGKLRNGLEEITHQTKICYLEDGSLLVLIDGHDGL